MIRKEVLMSYFPPYIDASGIHMPTYEDRLQDLLSACRSIFGQEAELDPAMLLALTGLPEENLSNGK